MNISGRQWILLTAVISGFSIFINKFIVIGFSPFVFTGVKNAVVAIFLLSSIVLLGNLRKFKEISKKELRNLIIIGIVGGSIPFMLFFYGLQITSAAKAAFLHKSMFIYVAILAFFFLGEKLSKKQILATCGLLAGLFFLTGIPMTLDLGAILILSAALFWAVENIISKHVLKTVPPDVVAFSRMGFGSFIILSLLATTGQVSELFSFNLAQLGGVLITALLLFAYVWTWYHGLQKTLVSEATSLLTLGAAITVLLDAAFALKITADQVAGVVLVVVCTAALVFFSKTVHLQATTIGARA